MQYLVNAAQMKSADQYTIQKLGVPSLELMERAADGCIQIMEQEKMDFSDVCVVCGTGNNGGDGFAIARMLLEKDYTGISGRRCGALHERNERTDQETGGMRRKSQILYTGRRTLQSGD